MRRMSTSRKTRLVALSWPRANTSAAQMRRRYGHSRTGFGPATASERPRTALFAGTWMLMLHGACGQLCDNSCPTSGGVGNRCTDGGPGAEGSGCNLCDALHPTRPIRRQIGRAASHENPAPLCSPCLSLPLTVPRVARAGAPIATIAALATRLRRHRRPHHRRRRHHRRYRRRRWLCLVAGTHTIQIQAPRANSVLAMSLIPPHARRTAASPIAIPAAKLPQAAPMRLRA